MTCAQRTEDDGEHRPDNQALCGKAKQRSKARGFVVPMHGVDIHHPTGTHKRQAHKENSGKRHIGGRGCELAPGVLESYTQARMTCTHAYNVVDTSFSSAASARSIVSSWDCTASDHTTGNNE